MGSNSLPKSKREKRRWIGLEIPEKIDSRKSLQNILEESELDSDGWRLYDFAKSDQGVSLAIVRVYLSHYESFRKILSDNKGQLAKHGMKSITSSGKIKLVRQKKPVRRPPSFRVSTTNCARARMKPSTSIDAE